jgi:hypothetical protein
MEYYSQLTTYYPVINLFPSTYSTVALKMIQFQAENYAAGLWYSFRCVAKGHRDSFKVWSPVNKFKLPHTGKPEFPMIPRHASQ